MRRIGVFGGTFDPPHVGHLVLAEWAWARLRLDRVVFVSGDLASEDVVRFSERSRRPLVQKPFDFSALFRALDRCAKRTAVPS